MAFCFALFLSSQELEKKETETAASGDEKQDEEEEEEIEEEEYYDEEDQEEVSKDTNQYLDLPFVMLWYLWCF